MKKILLCIVLFLSVFSFSSCVKIEWDDIINPEADFIYFYGKTCPHCVALNKELIKKDIYSYNILEKKEIYKNSTNQEEFNTLTAKLGLAREDVWVPFLYDKATRKHYVGQGDIMPILEAAIAE